MPADPHIPRMYGPRVIVDFPATARNSGRLAFGDPVRIIAAHRVEDVRPAIMEAERLARAGAWVAGFVAYEASPAFDPALITRPPAGPTPLLWFGVFAEPAAPAAIPATASPAMPATASAAIPATASAAIPATASANSSGAAGLPQLAWEPDVTRPVYDAAIRAIRDAIAAGDVYQVNHTLRFTAPCDIAASALHDALVAARHGRYSALIETDDWAVVSASPELFIDVSDRAVTVRPMKGTARRAPLAAEDDAAASMLRQSAKDRAENLMIVDLVRNDLGRVARFGSVAVHDMFAIETYPTVHQMTSTVTATLRDDVTLVDVFAAMFPCGSVTGAPKIAAMRHIAALERSPRGPYCGAVGMIRPGGHATFNVAIRTIVIDRRERRAVYGAGGGITWDSSPAAEYDEAVAKAGMLHESLPPFALIETMALVDGRIARRELHLERLAASARFWCFHDEAVASAADTIAREERAAPPGCWRVRVTVARDGTVDVTRSPLAAPPAETPSPATRTPAGVTLACDPVDSRDPLLRHKTTARAVYEKRRAAAPAVYDVLLFNEQGHITEFTNGNMVCEIDGELLTPPVAAGLLPGTFRRQLLDAGIIREADIATAALASVTRMWLINSVRGWVPVRLDDAATGRTRG